MYEEFLNAVLLWVRALNAADKEMGSGEDGMTPYLGHIPVLLEDSICGFLVDEIGGQYSYRDVTPEARAWWEARPWKRRSTS